MERTYDEEIHKRINHLLGERTCLQVECSEDAIRIVRIYSGNNGFLHKQLENKNSFGELFLKSMHRKFGREIG